MTVSASGRGHLTVVNEEGVWVYEDTGVPITEEDRPCPHCGKFATFWEPDPCLGYLPGVQSACCGHGNPKKSFIKFDNGVTIRGFTIDKD